MSVDQVKRILVVGAGQMGSQIAMQCALHGVAVTLNDLSGETASSARSRARRTTSSRKGSRPSRTSTRPWSWD